MTALAALSDASTMPLIPWGWLVLAAVAFAVLARPVGRRVKGWLDREPVRLGPAHTDAVVPPAGGATVPRANCTVPFCDEPVSVHVYAGDEWWTFCQMHGTPYLTEGLAS